MAVDEATFSRGPMRAFLGAQTCPTLGPKASSSLPGPPAVMRCACVKVLKENLKIKSSVSVGKPQAWASVAHATVVHHRFGKHMHVHMHACEALGSEARTAMLFTPEHLSCENVGWNTDDAVPHCSQDDHNTICLQARSPTGHALYGASTL